MCAVPRLPLRLPLVCFVAVECVWIGPYMIDYVCNNCILGYEQTSPDDPTCQKPKFGPHKGWEGSPEREKLTIRGRNGMAVPRNPETSAPILLTEHTYTIPAPQLEPKARLFAGYEQPHSKIKYELDFSLGADVDLGCGTSVFGNAGLDRNIPKRRYSHPLSMHKFSYQYTAGRGNPAADPPDPGYYPQRCARYHRFKITRPGNFTFDSCASTMGVGLGLYKRTVDLTKSAPRITPGGRLQSGQHYDVPLFNNDRQYDTVKTGLIPIQPDKIGQGFSDFFNAKGRPDPAYPRLTPDSIYLATNGCPMSSGVLRSYYIGEVGDYFLETMGADLTAGCNSFEVKMSCSGGAETASPAESNPLGFSVDADTGAITGTPERVRDGYTMRLRVVDAADERADVAKWTFDVIDPPSFKLNPMSGWSMETDGKLATKYRVAETHLLTKPRLAKEVLLFHPSGSAYVPCH